MRPKITRWTRGLFVAGLVAVLLSVWPERQAEAQGNFSAQIQLALRQFIATVHTWTATQTFTNVVINGTCTGCGSGTVSSVGLTAPAIFSVGGSPVTGSGTLALSLATETANTVWSGPTTGSAATPTFRALVAADIPSLSAVYAPIGATYITQTSNGSLTAEQALGSLATGVLKSSTTTGVVSIAAASDIIGLWSGTCNSSSVLGGDGVCRVVSSAFSGISSGTNTVAAMVVGTGASLAVTGTGTIGATSVTGLSVTAAKTLTVTNSLALSGTDSTTMTFPSTSATIARTDAANTFTGVQTMASPALSGETSITHGTITTALSPFFITETRNAAGVTFPGLVYNITDTASAAGSLYLDLQTGGTSKIRATKSPALILQGASASDLATVNVNGIQVNTTAVGQLFGLYNDGSGTAVQYAQGALGYITWQSTNRVDSGAVDLTIRRDGAGILAQRTGTAAQGLRLYNTFTTISTAGEWWKMDWQTTANQFRMGSVAGSSSGTARVSTWDYGSVLASATAAITVPVTSGNIVFGGGITIPGGATFLTTNTALTDGVGASAGTITNAPSIGNPTKWIGINDNGTTRYIPAW